MELWSTGTDREYCKLNINDKYNNIDENSSRKHVEMPLIKCPNQSLDCISMKATLVFRLAAHDTPCVRGIEGGAVDELLMDIV